MRKNSVYKVPGPDLVKRPFSDYRDCHSKDKTVVKPSYLNNWNPTHDDVIKWKHFPRYCCPFVGIHRSPVNSPHKGHWRGALMFSLICTRINGWVNNGNAGDLRRIRAHYDVTVMYWKDSVFTLSISTFQGDRFTSHQILLYLPNGLAVV